MSTSAPISPPDIPAISPDEFQALEQKVLRAVEIVRREREARASAEAEVARLQQQIVDQQVELDRQKAAHAAELDVHTANTQARISALQQERAEVRGRVEKMLRQMDEFL